MEKNREELNTLITQLKKALYDKDVEIKKRGDQVISYIIAEFKKLQMEGFSVIKRVETDLSCDLVMILQYKNAANELIIELNKVII